MNVELKLDKGKGKGKGGKKQVQCPRSEVRGQTSRLTAVSEIPRTMFTVKWQITVWEGGEIIEMNT